jgi:flagellar hook-basal body complex protein FliE
MSLAISSLTPVTSIAAPAASGGASKSVDFASIMDGVIQSVEQPRQEANRSIQSLLNGEGELHTVALSVQRADLAFQLGLQVRNKVVAAYQEIMKMQL